MIAEFEAGIDTIDLGGLAAAVAVSLGFIGCSRFHGVAGEVRYGGHILGVDLDGDGAADSEVRMRGEVALAAGDLHF